jgi:CheY-like chemotaxis protein
MTMTSDAHRDRRPHSPHTSAASPIRSTGRLAGIHVLLVDDDVDELATIAELLSEAGAEVVTATSAHDAIRALSRRVPDVIVSDISMPGCDGYHMLRMVRARGAQRGGSTPAIALTGKASPEDHTRALLASYQMHLTKPIRFDDLLVAIRRVVDARSGPGAR